MANADTENGFFEVVDTGLKPFLEALDVGQDRVRVPTDIIPLEAREMVAAIEARATEVVNSRPQPQTFGRLAAAIKSAPGLAGVEFQGGEHIGFFTVPGVNPIHSEDRSRRLVVPYLAFDRASAESLAKLGHFHVGAEVLDENDMALAHLQGEYADSWSLAGGSGGGMRGYKMGLTWSDVDGRVQSYTGKGSEGRVRVAGHASRDNYDAFARLTARARLELPNGHMGVYYGATDMKSTRYPAARSFRRA